jgi:ketosteroid isomerase-like protein
MRVLMLGLAMALGPPGALAAAPTEAELAAPVRQFFDAFDKGDMAGAAAAYAPGDITIVDEVPPFIWRGPDALKAWAAALGADVAKRDQTEPSVSLGEVFRSEVDGDKAYVIIPAIYAYKEKGKPMHDPARMTFTLTLGEAGWKITSWTWTGPKPVEGPPHADRRGGT